MVNLTTYGLALTLFIQLLVIMHFSYRNWMEQIRLGVLSMVECLSTTSLDPRYVLKPFYLFSIMNIPFTIAFKVMKNRKIQKTKKGRKEGGMKTRKAKPHAKKRNKSESVQAQIPLLKNTLLVSQTV